MENRLFGWGLRGRPAGGGRKPPQGASLKSRGAASPLLACASTRPLESPLGLSTLLFIEEFIPLRPGHLALHCEVLTVALKEPASHRQDSARRDELVCCARRTVLADQSDPATRNETDGLDLLDEITATKLEEPLDRLGVSGARYTQGLGRTGPWGRREAGAARAAECHLNSPPVSIVTRRHLDGLDPQRLGKRLTAAPTDRLELAGSWVRVRHRDSFSRRRSRRNALSAVAIARTGQSAPTGGRRGRGLRAHRCGLRHRFEDSRHSLVGG
jgi:hypothetical protein